MADDTRVVQMQFDNRNFERNIAKSQRSLDKFKKSLNFEAVGKGLSKFGDSLKNLAFDTLSNNIQKLTDKFTGLGDAGEYVLSRIRHSLESAALQAEQFIKTMTMDQISVGQNKYDALTKAVQTIVASGSATEEKAYSVMERVMEYTNQTSHSFETMVSQISSLTSIGVPLAYAEKLMEGFANASTKAGADAGRAAIAMQTYAKAMGSYLTKNEFDTLNLTAKVVTKEWREQLVEAGIAAGDLVKDVKGVIKTAKKYGKQVTVTVDNLESTLAKKWASRATLNKFGEKYMFGETIEDLQHPEDAIDSFGKTAYLTGQRALTLADGLNAVKESISSGWMTTFRLIFGDLTDAMNLWTGSCNKVIDALSGLSEARNEIIRNWSERGGRDSLLALLFGEMVDAEGNTMYEGAYGLLDVLTDIGNLISDGFWSMVQMFLPDSVYNESISTWGKNSEYQFWVLGEMLKDFTISLREAIANLKAFFNEKPEGSDKTRWDQIREVVSAVFTTIGFIAAGIEGLLYFFGLIGAQLSPSAKEISKVITTLAGDVKEGETDIVRNDKIKKFFEDLAETLRPFTDIINDVVTAFSEMIIAIAHSDSAAKGVDEAGNSIGSAFRKALGDIAAILRPFADFLVTVFGAISELFGSSFTEEDKKKAQEKVRAAFNKLIKSIKIVLTPIFEEIKKWFLAKFDEIKKKVTDYFNDPKTLGHKILQPIKKVIEFLSPVWGFLKKIFEKIKGLFFGKEGKGMTLFDTLKTLFMSKGVTKLFSKLKDLAKDGGLYKLIMGALGVYSIWQIIKAVKTIGGFFSDVGGNLKAGVLGTYEWFSEKLQGIAKGLLMLTASVAILGLMDTGSVVQGIIALGVIMVEFIGFMKLMDVINPATIAKQATMTGLISLFAGALAILVVSLLPFAFISWEGLAKMIVGLGAVLVELIGFMYLSQIKMGLRPDKLVGFIGFAFSIAILMASLIPFMLADWQSMLRGIAGLALVMLELVGFMALVTYLPLGTASLGPFVGFAAAIAILMFSLIPFMIADWQSMLRGVAGLALVMSELIGFMLLVTYLPIGTAQLGGFAAFSASIGLLMLALIPFMVTDWQGMLRAVAGLGIVLVELIGFMELFKVFGLSTMALNFAGMLGFTFAIGVLVLSLLPFMLMDWQAMLRGVSGLGIVLLELIGFMELFKVLGLSTLALDFAGILGFAISIGVLALAMKTWAYMEWEQWARSVAGLAVVFGLLLAFMAIVNLIPVNAASIGTAIALCLSISVMALLLSVAMNEVRNLKWEVISAFTTGLAVVMMALAGAIVILSAVPFAEGIKGIGLLSIALAAIIGVVALVGPMLLESLGDSFTRLSGKLELVSGLLKGFSDRMGAIDESNIDKAEGIFAKIKKLLGTLAGWGKFSGDLNNFQYSMFVLGTGMEIFNNHAGKVSGEVGGNADAALKFIRDLSGCAGNLSTIEKMNMDILTSKIAGLGGAMYLFGKGAQEAAGLEAGETPDVEGAMRILRALSTALNEEGGFTIPENMPDETQMNLFGASIAALAAALVLFEEAGSGLGEGTEKALGCLDFFKKLKDRLVTTEFVKELGATIGIFDKEQVQKEELNQFGANIEALGLALQQFNNSVTYLNEETGERTPIDFSNAITTLDSLVDLQGKLGWDFGPLIEFFVGRKKDFNDLGGEIEALGTALADFNAKLSGVDEQGNPKLDTKVFEDAIAVADQIVNYMTTLKEKMGTVGGLVNIHLGIWYGRDFNFTDLKKQMTDLADGVGSLGQLKVDNKLLTVDEAKGVFKICDLAIDYMNTLKKKMRRVGGVAKTVETFVFGRDFNFTDLKTQLTALGEGLNGLSSFKADDLPTKEEMEKAFPMIDALLDYEKELKKKMGRVGGMKKILDNLEIGREFDFTDLKTQLTSLGEGLNSISSVNIDSKGNTLFNEQGRGAALTTIDALIIYMETLGTKIGRIGGIKQFLSNAWNGKEADFEYVGGQLGKLGEGLGQFQAGITKNGEFNADKVSTALGALDHLVSMMQTFSVLQEKMDAISESYGLSSYTMKDFIRNMWDSLSLMTNGFGGGGSVVDQLAVFIKEFDMQLTELGGLENIESVDILNNVATALSTLVTAARNMQNPDGTVIDFVIVGQNISNGIAVGIANATGVVEAAARAVVQAAVAAANAEADSHSPSRVFMTVGGFMGQGMALGFRNEQANVQKAAANVTDGAIETAGDAMTSFANLMAQDIDANPTITPVLDLSNITAGSEEIDRLLHGSYGVGRITTDLSPRLLDGDSGGHIPRDYSGALSRVTSEISDMRSDLQGLAESMKNLKLVMSTGEVVGAIGPEMDNYLGKAGFYYSRI